MTRQRIVRKSDLFTRPGRKYRDGWLEGRQPVLYCAPCHAEYSATPGDYWQLAPSDPMLCGDCGAPLMLGDFERRFVPVALGRKGGRS